MTYVVSIKPSARKELEKIPKPFRVRIIEIISSLADNPRPHGYKKMVNFENCFRIRFGNYRIVYRIEDKLLMVEVIKVGNRRDVYR